MKSDKMSTRADGSSVDNSRDFMLRFFKGMMPARQHRLGFLEGINQPARECNKRRGESSFSASGPLPLKRYSLVCTYHTNNHTGYDDAGIECWPRPLDRPLIQLRLSLESRVFIPQSRCSFSCWTKRISAATSHFHGLLSTSFSGPLCVLDIIGLKVGLSRRMFRSYAKRFS